MYQFIQCYTQAQAHTHPQTIGGLRTDGAKSENCQLLVLIQTVTTATVSGGCLDTSAGVWVDG